MPLHLLGKKSWNVYNAANIERVRRDEAAATAREEAKEQRMQEVDAERRLAILRGEVPLPLEDEEEREKRAAASPPPEVDRHHGGGRERKKRKRQGEDDTEFEMRLASERNEQKMTAMEGPKRTTSSASITDHRGHIDLFGDERARAHAEKNEEVEGEKKRRKQEHEDQYTMRLAKAAGKSGLGDPWYSQADPRAVGASGPSKDVWGNEDPLRMERNAQRSVASDPLAMMKLGASRVREVKAERKKLQADQREEVRKLESEQRDDRRRRHREHHRRGERSRAERSRSRSRSREHRRRRAMSDSRDHRSDSRKQDERGHHGRRQRDDKPCRPRSRERQDERTKSHRDSTRADRRDDRRPA